MGLLCSIMSTFRGVRLRWGWGEEDSSNRARASSVNGCGAQDSIGFWRLC